MATVGSYVKRYYEALEEGKIFAAHCNHCGNYEFPPKPICNECGHHDMKWVEISGKGELIASNDCTMPMFGPEIGPVLSGVVKLEEGPQYLAFIDGVPMEEREELFDRLPVKVHAVIQQRDSYKECGFEVDKEQ